MALPVRPRLGIKGSIRQTRVLTAFVSGRVFYFFFIWLKYNFYLTSFRMTVPQNRSTPRDIHYFLWSCLGSPSTFHLPSSLIYFTLSESLMCFFFSPPPRPSPSPPPPVFPLLGNFFLAVLCYDLPAQIARLVLFTV